MDLILQGNTPAGLCLLVQYFYTDHYPLPYKLPYQFVRRRGTIHLQPVKMKYAISKFIPVLLSLIMATVSTAGIYCLSGEDDHFWTDVRFWTWILFIAIGALSIYGYCTVTLNPLCLQIWERTVSAYWHLRKGIIFISVLSNTYLGLIGLQNN